MNLSPKQKEDLLRCVHKSLPQAQVFIFGSRAKGTAKKTSDLDILIKTDHQLSDLELSKLREAFSLSSLPFFVDAQDYYQVNAEFMEWIEKDLIKLTHQ